MESFFSSLKTERTARKVYRTRDAVRADVFDYVERFCNSQRRHPKLGSKPGGVRGPPYANSTWCPGNRQQANEPNVAESAFQDLLRAKHRRGDRPLG